MSQQVNNDPNDVALQASDLTPLEIAYYREVVSQPYWIDHLA